ncbi:MAG: hypothetical protein BGO01_19660 [Armatimonadetes bacterium 55-13]|nr:hypothetical protein [Armatimonadota bacterium]ODU51514.1 MAG: hypothetical protein ABT09_03750 [bacterium SCN 57-13]OJU64330.1 MAG: hypothetical protein BGO01_19660 [Armatimonadetes bacterium 55-13]
MTTDQFNSAMETVLEWGPERMKTDDERLAVRCPGMSPKERAEAIRVCGQVTSRAYEYAAKAKSGGTHLVIKALRKEWPGLSSENASRAVSQAMYYHWRETGE